MRGHNSAYNAGIFAKEMGCKVVALNHFGTMSETKEYVSRMVSEAREENNNASQIIAAHDFLEVWVPRGGYDFRSSRDGGEQGEEECAQALAAEVESNETTK